MSTHGNQTESDSGKPIKRHANEPPSSSTAQYSIMRKSQTPKGLQNLGNTCFMNSALQCLSHTVPLTTYCLGGTWENEVNADNPLGMGGRIAQSYVNLIQSLWLTNDAQVVPRLFKRTIGERNPTFIGYGQQDSHELLQSLLDGLHEDLNRIKKKEYVEDPEMKDMTESEFAKASWDAYIKRNDSKIVDLFQAQLKSRTECQVCHKVSIKFDPYMYLQLPVPESRHTYVTVTAVPVDGSPITIAVKAPRHCSIDFLKLIASREMKWPSETQRKPELTTCVEIWNSKIYRVLTGQHTIGDISPNDHICIYQLSEVSEYFNRIVDSRVPLHPNVPRSYSLPINLTKETSGRGETPIGLPLYLSVPSQVVFTDFSSDDDCLAQLGEVAYKSIIDILSNYSKYPLYRRIGTSLNLLDIYHNRGEPLTHDFFKDLRFKSADGFEPIPEIFSIDLTTARPAFKYDSSPNYRIYPLHIEEEKGHSEGDATPTEEDGDFVMVDPSIAKHRNNMGEPYSSPRSDLSDITNKMKTTDCNVDDNFKSDGEIIRPNKDEKSSKSQPAKETKKDYQNFNFSSNHQFDIKFQADSANFLFDLSEDRTQGRFEPTKSEALSTPKETSNTVITLEQCMKEFTKVEILEGQDTMYCSQCKEHRETKKELSVYSTPEILVIHLKRFSSSGRHTHRSKIDDLVNAPITGLDMSRLLGHTTANSNDVYDLFGVSNHFGGLGGGHYTAYVKNPLDDSWYNCDDSSTNPLESDVMTKAAYLLFYRRRNHPADDLDGVIETAKPKYEEELKSVDRKRALENDHYDSSDRMRRPSEGGGFPYAARADSYSSFQQIQLSMPTNDPLTLSPPHSNTGTAFSSRANSDIVDLALNDDDQSVVQDIQLNEDVDEQHGVETVPNVEDSVDTKDSQE
ncbi:hypothetical protein BC833DRAFT_621681 [Globomyces pollinis-pini]|nr:hypothetical protein BC833DRAFT_621681 [Globomyces pollinis-pini]